MSRFVRLRWSILAYEAKLAIRGSGLSSGLRGLAGITLRRVANKRHLLRLWLRQRARQRRGFSGPISVAFDLKTWNPVQWHRETSDQVAAAGPAELLPAGTRVDRTVAWHDRRTVRRMHHLLDVAGFHANADDRAAALVRLAACGTLVYLADGGPGLKDRLGAELHDLMTASPEGLDRAERELRSIQIRRTALIKHSTWVQSRHPHPAALPNAPKLPLVSILLASTRRQCLPSALDAVARQSYPRRELILAVPPACASEAEQRAVRLPCPARVWVTTEGEPLGSVLSGATALAAGPLLAKMDDDDAYGSDHLWDLVLARQYSGAQLVGKAPEYVYLAGCDRMIACKSGFGEDFRAYSLAGGTLMISRRHLDEAGGWRKIPAGVDWKLVTDVLRAGGSVYRTHGSGFVLVRHGVNHTWTSAEDAFLAEADRILSGWCPAAAGIRRSEVPAPPFPHRTGDLLAAS